MLSGQLSAIKGQRMTDCSRHKMVMSLSVRVRCVRPSKRSATPKIVLRDQQVWGEIINGNIDC